MSDLSETDRDHGIQALTWLLEDPDDKGRRRLEWLVPIRNWLIAQSQRPASPDSSAQLGDDEVSALKGAIMALQFQIMCDQSREQRVLPEHSALVDIRVLRDLLQRAEAK